MKRIILLLSVISLVTCTSVKQVQNTTVGLLADSAMVVSAHPLASQTGLQVIRKGGNAIDAAIATQFTQRVW